MAKKHKVLVSDKLSETGLKILRDSPAIQVDVKTGMSPEELIKTIKDYEGIVIRSGTKVTEEVLKAAKKLKVIGRAGAGVDKAHGSNSRCIVVLIRTFQGKLNSKSNFIF